MLKHKLKNLIWITIAGVFYVIWLKLGFHGIPCVFKKVTGLMCPGCGVTHLILSLIRLDLELAYKSNPFIFITLPYIAFILSYEFLLKEKLTKYKKVIDYSINIYLVLLLIFGLLRNI